MKKNYGFRFFALAAILLLGMFVVSCRKDKPEEDVVFVPISCTVNLDGSARVGLSVMTFGSGFSLTSDTSQLYVQESDKPQTIIVADDDNHVRMLYRDVVSEGQNITIDAHSTALAMITCNPIVAMAGDADPVTMARIIVQLQSFPAFESLVAAEVASGKDLFDTTNTQMIQSAHRVFDELLGTCPDAMDSKDSDPLPWVDCTPLRFEWKDQSQGGFYLSNYSLCPTYYGTISTPSGGERHIVLPTITSYNIIDGFAIFFGSNPDRYHGERVEVSLTKGEDNTIELTNLNDSRAVTDIATHVFGDFMNMISLKLPNSLLSELLSMGGVYLARIVEGYVQTEGGIIRQFVIAKKITFEFIDWTVKRAIASLTESGFAFAANNGLSYAKKVLEIGAEKLLAWYNTGEGFANFAMRIYYLLCYPNDITFCIHYTTDGDRIITRPCGGRTEPLHGVFSVSTTKQVRFSPGNLEIGGRSFTSHQYDYGGHFAWGTGNNPDNPSTDWHDYTTFHDWGDYVEGNWRTLSNPEWNYLFNSRQNASEKYGYGTIEGTKGIIILPDNWTLPSGCTFSSGYNTGEENWYRNSYSLSQWELMEAGGAVFFPAAGTYYQDLDEGFYWSSTPCSAPWTAWAYSLWFSAHSINSKTSGTNRNFKISVRLVWDNN